MYQALVEYIPCFDHDEKVEQRSEHHFVVFGKDTRSNLFKRDFFRRIGLGQRFVGSVNILGDFMAIFEYAPSPEVPSE